MFTIYTFETIIKHFNRMIKPYSYYQLLKILSTYKSVILKYNMVITLYHGVYGKNIKSKTLEQKK